MNVRDSVGRWLEEPREELPTWQRRARFAVDLGRHCGGNLLRDRASQMAAALAFHTVFSLLPMLVMMLVALQSFRGVEHYQERLHDGVIRFLFPDSVVSENADAAGQEKPASPDVRDEAVPPSDMGAAVGAAAGVDVVDGRAEFDRVRGQVAARVKGVLSELSNVSFGGIGIVGLLFFIYGATGLLATIERSFNAILRLGGGRPWYLRLMLYYTVITLGPMVLIAGELLQGKVIGALSSGQWGGVAAWAAGPLVVLSPLITAWFVLLAMFVLLPAGRVRVRPAAVGSLVSAFLWVIGKELFAVYVRNAGVTSVYGAMALVPLFLLWLWITWMIVLFGLEITETLMSARSGRFESQELRGADRRFADVSWIVLVAARVAARFEGGESAELAELSRGLGLPRRLVQQILEALERLGVVRVLTDGEQRNYVLARPARSISVAELLDGGQAQLGFTPGGDDDEPSAGARAFLVRLRDAWRETAGELTLASLVPVMGEDPNPMGEPPGDLQS